MLIEREMEAIRECVSRLETSAATAEQWRKLDARVFSAILQAQVQLVAQQRAMIERVKARRLDGAWLQSHSRVNEMVLLLDRLNLVRLGVQGRIVEHEASERRVLAD